MSEQHLHTIETVAIASKSSFLKTMKLMPEQQRDGIYSVYAFCRHVDDVVDLEGPLPDKQKKLLQWTSWVNCVSDGNGLRHRDNLPAPAALLAQVEGNINRFNLPTAELHEVIAGMRQDLPPTLFCPSISALQSYCRRVAGAVGLLSMPIFGLAHEENADLLALTTGEALQITNILRDLDEDLAIGRCYLPEEFFQILGLPLPKSAEDIRKIFATGHKKNLEEMLCFWAQKRFEEALNLLSPMDSTKAWPIRAMILGYHHILKEKQSQLHKGKIFKKTFQLKLKAFISVMACRYGFQPRPKKLAAPKYLPENYVPPLFNTELQTTGSLDPQHKLLDKAELPQQDLATLS